MKYQIKTLIICCSLLLTGCDDVKDLYGDTSKLIKDEYRSFNWDKYHISAIRLVVTPKKYHGKNIQILGYLDYQQESHKICLSKHDSENGIYRNCFWIDGEPIMEHNQKYVFLAGKFDRKDLGHMGMYGGTFKKVERIEPTYYEKLKTDNEQNK